MINIISNATPTVTVNVTSNQVGIYYERISLTIEDAEKLYAVMQTKTAKERLEEDSIKKLLSLLDGVELVSNDNKNVEIKFEESFIKYMKEKYPTHDYDCLLSGETVYCTDYKNQ